MNPAIKRFQKTYGPIVTAVSSVDIGQTNREAVALALADALDGRPDFRRDLFLTLASDPLVVCMGVQGIPCRHDRRIRVAMHDRHAVDGRAASWQESLPLVRCVSCGFDQRAAEVLESIDFERETHGAGDPSRGRVPTDNPRDMLYPGRMSAHPGPDEEVF